MLIVIPTGMKFTATMVGSVAKLVTCDHCKTEYVYFIRHRVTAETRSPMYLDNQGAAERARETAHRQLLHALKTGHALAPCPACGHYSNDMLLRARHKRVIAAAAFSVLSLVLYCGLWKANTPLFASMLRVSWGLPGLGALVVISGLLLLWAWKRNLNAGAKSRLARGKRWSMLRSEYDAMLAQASANG